MKRLFLFVGLMVMLTVVGTVGIHVVTDKPWLESSYLAVITLTTVGSRDAAESGEPQAVLFVMAYIILGFSIFTYGAFQLGQILLNAELRSMLERRHMERSVAHLSDHYIICGIGRMGESICEYLTAHRRPFVVVDNDEERLTTLCKEQGWLYLLGDATDDVVLEKAGVHRARSLATTLATDADNVYVVLSARMLCRDVQIVARASDADAVKKLERAGATRVVSPVRSGGVKIARFMLNPSVEDFLEVTDQRGGELELADVQIDDESPYVGKQLAETDLRKKGVMIIGIRRANGERLLPPPGSAVIEAGDSLFAVGSSDAVNGMMNSE